MISILLKRRMKYALIVTILPILRLLVSNSSKEHGYFSFTSLHPPNSEDYKLILLWNEYQHSGYKLYDVIFERILTRQCPVNNCKFTTDKSLQNESSAIIFHLPNLHWEGYNYPTYRDPSIPWILMTYETFLSIAERSYLYGKYPRLDTKVMNNIFNRTMSFREDSDIVARHGYVGRLSNPLSDAQLKEAYSQTTMRSYKYYTKDYFTLHQLQNISEPLNAPIVWFVSHCRAMSGREIYVKKLQRFIGVDVYGKCGPFSCGTVMNIKRNYDIKDPCFELVNKNYKFYISMENSVCKDYITEKAYNALKLNTVPIVLGGVNYTSKLPPGSYINAGLYRNMSELSDYLYELLQNDTKYNQYFDWRRHYTTETYRTNPDPCELCSKLHSGELSEPKVYKTLYDWLGLGSGCLYAFWNSHALLPKIWALAGLRSLPPNKTAENEIRNSSLKIWGTN